MSPKSMLLLFLAAELLALAPAAQAAPAADSPDAPADPFAPSVTVKLSDLDLTAEAGGKVALGRIRQAADQICGGAPNLADLERFSLYDACMAETVERAVASVGSPVLAALKADSRPSNATQTASRRSRSTPG